MLTSLICGKEDRTLLASGGVPQDDVAPKAMRIHVSSYPRQNGVQKQGSRANPKMDWYTTMTTHYGVVGGHNAINQIRDGIQRRVNKPRLPHLEKVPSQI